MTDSSVDGSLSSSFQSTFVASQTPVASLEVQWPDVTGWSLEEARREIEAVLIHHNGGSSLQIVQTAPPPPREAKPEREVKRQCAPLTKSAVTRQTPMLGSWRVLRCRIAPSTLENSGPETNSVVQIVIEIVVAREIVASQTASDAPFPSPPSI